MKTLTTKLPTLLLLLLASSCVPRLYTYEITDPHSFKSIQQSIPEKHAKYIIVEDHFSSELKECLAEMMEYSYLKGRMSRRAQKLSTEVEREFLLGVIAMDSGYYLTARQHFQKIAPELIQARLLLLDCQQELSEEKDYYSDYQEVYDQAEDDTLRELVKARYKFYRYGI